MPPLRQPQQARMWHDAPMRTSTAVVGVAVLLSLSGCADEKDSNRKPRDADPNATITTGTYELSHFDMHKDGCDTNYSASDFNGSFLSVTITGNSGDLNGVLFSFSNGVVTGSDFIAGQDVFGDNSCFVDISISEDGTIPENDQIDVIETTEISNPTGDCGAISVDLPCETRFFVRLTKQ